MEEVGSNRIAASCCLRLEAVGRRFGALVAVSDVSLEIPYGERRAIIGANGAGKTTLFNTIAGDFRRPVDAIYCSVKTSLAFHPIGGLGADCVEPIRILSCSVV